MFSIWIVKKRAVRAITLTVTSGELSWCCKWSVIIEIYFRLSLVLTIAFVLDWKLCSLHIFTLNSKHQDDKTQTRNKEDSMTERNSLTQTNVKMRRARLSLSWTALSWMIFFFIGINMGNDQFFILVGRRVLTRFESSWVRQKLFLNL